ncbi:flagellin N-terminal helical domain-containing protein [Dethiobacter alkaliphilus]|uniref:Flagellin n=1 Tax=Dethiobacter alkaliphilus AHT 1 TaxID=555088 RepID=C0GJJ8_DETAL|nr:flagellin [Dethiobacter alkaliphilus]EEG76545.1 flagellin domain protein [Dethiobacter alkaliphilus AHT 1]
MRINNNIMAMNTHRQLSINNNSGANSMEKLSSGFRINRAGDDAAGLSISEKMRGQIRGLQQASRNAQDGISMIQTAEGSLQEAHAILQRMRELSVQAANDTNVAADRTSIKDELDELKLELTRINNNTQFNTENVLDGTAGTAGKVNLLVGANKGEEMELDLTIKGIKLDDVISSLVVDVSDSDKAQDFVELVNTAITDVSAGRSKLGAWQNRLEHTIKNLDNAAENLQAAESRIRDVDMAKEMMDFTKANILQQASTAMLAQANMAPQSVLQLLG